MNESSGASLIDLQIMWHRLIAVVEEQAQVLLRTAFSPIVRECGDLSAGVFDLKGRMLAQAVTGTPGHVRSMASRSSISSRISRSDDEGRRRLYLTIPGWTGHLNEFRRHHACFKDRQAVVARFPPII